MEGVMSGGNMLFLLMRDPWALLLLLLISLVPTGFFGWGLYVDYRIATEGTSVQATVTDYRAVASRSRNGSTSYRYKVEYEFLPPGETRKHTAYWMHDAMTVTVPKADYDRAVNTKRLEVLYIAGQPELNRPKHCKTTHTIVLFFSVFLSVNMALLVGVFVAIHYRRTWRTRQMQIQRQTAGVTEAGAGYATTFDDESRTQDEYVVNV